ncbi:MAG: A24 family peptidase [Pseudomonadales bacterium]|nr:A24 family peptidase [Pseudomonadales bacterium]
MALIDLLQTSMPALIGLAIVLGLMVGSFLNVVIYRLPIMLQREWRQQCIEFLELDPTQVSKPMVMAEFTRFDLAKPDSHCPHCKNPVRVWANIPLLSYFLLRGKCAACSAPISPRYPLIEALSGVMSGLVAWQLGPQWLTLYALVLSWSLLALTLIDFDHQLLPDNITLPLLWLGLLVNTLLPGFASASDAIIGAAAGYLCLWSIYHLFRLLTGREGMGYGDFKLLAVLGAWLGWQSLLSIVLLSSLSGAVIGIFLLLFRGHDRNIPIPFGPYLALAGFITLLWGEQLIALTLGGQW